MKMRANRGNHNLEMMMSPCEQHRPADFKELLGKTLTCIHGGVDCDTLTFYCTDGSIYIQKHDQDCCESVSVEDICGDITDLLMSPIIQADESSSDEFEGRKSKSNECESRTWTFYRIGTTKGSVTIRWFGESNGYYSEEVNFSRIR